MAIRLHFVRIATLLLCALAVLVGSQSIAAERTFETFKPDQPANRLHMKDLRAPCDLSRHNIQDTVIGYSSTLATGDQIITYFSPATCGSPTYPFEIQSMSFPLIAFDGYTWPIEIDVVVYSAGIQPCLGPVFELCRQTVVCDEATFKYPNFGTVEFDVPCCVDQPFFIGLEYTDTSTGDLPSWAFDVVSDPDSCLVFQLYDSTWYEWHIWWYPYMPGFPIFEVHGETISSACCTDTDGDGICDSVDNCPGIANADQADADGDGIGDVCDNCPNDYNPDQLDSDGDSFADACDNCPNDPNSSQEDADNDGIGDVCDICPDDPYNDQDSDGICGDIDNCPGIANPGQEDSNSNGIGDACESCCLGTRGDVSYDGSVNIQDLTYLVAYLFSGGPPPPCWEEANVNGDVAEAVNIEDVTYLVQYLFAGGAEPPSCP